MFRKEVIGDCELYLGDCMDIMPTLGKVDAVVTDPPFGMSFQSNYRELSHREIANDADEKLLIWACNLPANHSVYAFCRWDNLPSIPKPKSFINWVKNNWSMGDLQHEHGRQTEQCAFYAGPNHYWPKKRPTDVVYSDRTGNNYHPTEKSVDLMQKVIEWTAGVVVDPFMGSGTTGVSCVKLGRKFIGIELDEKYFDIACRRIEEAYKQPDLFIKPTKKPVQGKLI